METANHLHLQLQLSLTFLSTFIYKKESDTSSRRIRHIPLKLNLNTLKSNTY